MAQYDINLREYWRILKKRKFVVILVAIVLGLFSTSLAILKAPSPLYTTVCIIEFEEAPTVQGVYGQTISMADSDDVETQITVIKSYSVFQKVAEKLRLIPRGALKEDGQLKENIIPIIESLQGKVEVERESFTSILNIKVTDANPLFAQKLANTIAVTYKELHAEDQMKRTKETLKYIAQQLTEVRVRLRESEDEFNRFSQENELVAIDLQSENLLARAQEIQDKIRMFQEDKREMQDVRLRLNQFIKNPSGSGHDFYSATANSQYQSTYNTLVGLLLKKDTLLKDFTPKHPEVLAISYEIIENARKMVILLQLQISGIEKKESDLRKELEKVDRKTKVLMDKKLEFNRLKRKVELYNDMTALLEKKNQEALIRRAERPEEVKIVKPALLPTHPINPPKTVTTGAMGVIIGLILGIVIGFIVETFDTSLGAIEDVEETLGTPVLGIIPHVDIRDIRESLKKKYPEGISLPDETHMSYLISHFVPKSMMAESFRALRTNVQFKDAGKKTKTIAVTSSSPQEGKTLVAINLAIAMAQARMKVLLIGSDLRKPTIDRVFDLEMTPGLTDILMENYQWRDTVKTVMDMVMGKMTQTQVIRTPGLDNLHIITSGPIPPNPAELIDSPGFRDLIEEAKKEYDIIIFDSPPILSTADAAILGAKVDGVLLVYRVGTVSRGLLKRSTTQLEQVECNLMGVILNGMRPEVSPDFQDYKYYTYYYSYGEEGEGKKRGERKKRLAFLRRKGDSPRREAQKTSLGEKGEAPQVEPRKKINMVRLALLLVAIAFLAVGILWQSGIIEPFKQSGVGRPVRKDKVKTAVKKEISKTAIGRELKKGPKKPKTEAPVEKAGAERVMSISKSRPVAKAMEETKTPVVTKRTSTQPIPKKPEAISKEPKPTVVDKSAAKGINSVKKDASDTAIREKPKTVSTKPKSPIIVKEPELQPERVTSIPKSPPDAKVVADIKTPASSEKIASHPYSLLLYHFRSLERAKNAVSLYNKKGLSAYWVKVELSNGVWYRVFVGYFEDRDQAERFRREHGLLKSTIKKTKYANLIGIYSSSDELEDKILSLKGLGYSPYTMTDRGGKSRLFVGTFITKEGAEKQYDDLKSNGIKNMIVER